jgi:glycosyltransferase involved in cell wall biosynthesis
LNSLPNVSVVVPFFNSKETLPSLLNSLLSQTYPKEKYEIILVDDGSTDDSVKQLEEVLCSTVAPPIKLLHNRQKEGPANARNKGIIESSGDIIALTDSDTIPDVNWLTSLINSFLNSLGNSNVGGVRGETITDSYLLFPVRIAPIGITGGFKTCNIAYTKAALLKAGLFDEKFQHPFGEDGDLAHRVLDSGYTIISEPTAKVLHPVKKRTLKQVIHDGMLRQYEVLFFCKHPKEAKDYGEWFMRPSLSISRKIGLSYVGIGSILYLSLLVTSLALGSIQSFLFEILIVGILLLCVFIFFAIFGYKRLAFGIQPSSVPISERLFFSMALIVFYIVTYIARIVGSLKFKAIMV